jgi:uncharacterized protein (TIGR02147 family)
MVSVFQYMNYRSFLRDYYNEKKREKSGFTYAKFSSLAGIRSPNYLKLVMDGEKNLTSENIIRFSKAIDLKEAENDYFEALVHFNQAKNAMEKEFHQSRLKRIHGRDSGSRTIEEYEFDAISSWLHHALMVMTNVKRFREDPSWIAQHLYGLACETEVRSVIDRLIQVQFIKREADGSLRQTFRQVKTKPDLQRVAGKLFYEGLLKRAIQALNVGTPGEREFCTYIVGIAPEKIPELKKKVREFMKDLNAWALESAKPSQVHALCFAGFPLTCSTERT